MTSQIYSSPAAQWLQGLLAKGAPSQVRSHSNTGSTELPRDSSRISAQAFQLNQAAGASSSAHARAAQSSGVSAAHHHRLHHRDDQNRDTSFVSRAARTTVSHLQRDTRADGPASSTMIGRSPAPSDFHESSFIEERASKLANDLRVAYSHVGASASPDTNSSGIRSISLTA